MLELKYKFDMVTDLRDHMTQLEDGLRYTEVLSKLRSLEKYDTDRIEKLTGLDIVRELRDYIGSLYD